MQFLVFLGAGDDTVFVGALCRHTVMLSEDNMQVIPDGPTCKNMKLLPHKYPVRRWLSHRWTLPWRSLLDSKRKLRSQNSPAGILKKSDPQ